MLKEAYQFQNYEKVVDQLQINPNNLLQVHQGGQGNRLIIQNQYTETSQRMNLLFKRYTGISLFGYVDINASSQLVD